MVFHCFGKLGKDSDNAKDKMVFGALSMSLTHISSNGDFTINILGHTLIPAGIIATLVGYLPTVVGVLVAFLGAVFYGIQIYESKTFQHWRTTRLIKKKNKHLARLRAKERAIMVKIKAIENLEKPATK